MKIRLSRRVWRLLAIIATTASLVWLVHVPILRQAGAALVWADPVRTADVVVVPSWAGDAGALQAADLVKSGAATRVAVINAPPDPADKLLIERGIVGAGEQSWSVNLLHTLGVPRVELIGYANGTESEAALLHRWCEAQRIGVAIAVSTPDHARRFRRILSRLAPEGGTQIIVVPTEYTKFDPQNWWTSRAGLRTGVVELEKLLVDVVRHPLN